MHADLAAHLDGDLDHVGLGGLGVVLGPSGVVDRARLVQLLVPELLGPVGANGSKAAHDVAGGQEAQGLVAIGGTDSLEIVVGGVHHLHDSRDGGVELRAVEVLGALHDRAVELAIERLGGLVGKRAFDIALGGRLGKLAHGTPGALEEAVAARNGLGIPVEVLLGRGDEENGQAHGVGAIGLDDRAGRHDVALGLAHRLAVLVLHHALAQQVDEGLVDVAQAQVAADLGPETRVEQVENGVLDSADVVVDAHPVVRAVLVEGQLRVVRVDVAQVIPARAGKGVHRVGLATGRLAAAGARRLVERLALGERLAGSKVEVLGQTHRELVGGNGHDAAVLAVHHGDGVAPIALTGDEPVTQAEVHLATAGTHGLEVGHDGSLALGMLAAHHAGVLAGLHEEALGRHGRLPIDARHDALTLVLELGVEGVVLPHDDGDDGQVVLLGELEVALVAAGNCHDGARAVVGDDVVGDPDGHLDAVDGVHHIAAGEGAVLLELALGALDCGDLLGTLDDLADGSLVFGARDKVHKALVLGGEQEEGATEKRVGTRGEDRDLLIGGLARGIAERELNLGTLRAADPVGLHLLDALGPARQRVKIVEQLLGIVGDLEVPLLEVTLLRHAAATPALAVGHLLVGKNGVALGAPVDRVLLAVGKAALPHLLEHPLAPAVVLGVAGAHEAVVVVGEAHAAHGGQGVVHVGVRPLGSLGVVLDGGVLSRQAEGVEAHGMQDVEAAHAGLTSHGVADGVVARMAHVEVARGVREHLKDVLLGLGGILIGLEEVLVGPSLLPLGLDGGGVVRRDAVLEGGRGVVALSAHALCLSCRKARRDMHLVAP